MFASYFADKLCRAQHFTYGCFHVTIDVAGFDDGVDVHFRCDIIDRKVRLPFDLRDDILQRLLFGVEFYNLCPDGYRSHHA